MKKNELKNKKIISALMIGISASMALMPSMNVYANEDEGGEPEEPAVANEQVEETQESSTQEAEERAEDTAEAIDEAQDEVNEVVDEILESDNKVETEDVGAIAEESVEDVVEQAEQLGADLNLENAEISIENVKVDLERADESNKIADEAAVEAVSDVIEADKISKNIEETVNEATEKAEELQEKFDEAGTVEEAKEIAGDIEKLVDDTKADVSAKVEYYNRLKDKYDDAVKALEQAEKDIDDAIDDAGADTRAALANLADAKAAVERLGEALEEAEEELAVEKNLMDNLSKAFSDVQSNGSWDNQGKLLLAYVANYYLPQVEGIKDVSSIKMGSRVRGFDRQDYNYYSVTYTDNDGNTVTRYFNYDRVDKKPKAGDPYANLGSSKEIAAFEKSAEEIGADNYLKKIYATALNNELKNYDTLKNNTKAGEYRVFAYTEDGETKYIAKAQLDGTMADDRTITEVDGVTYVDGNAIHEVVQNSNSLFKDNNIIVNTKVEKESIQNFIDSTKENIEKFENYNIELDEARDAVINARNEAISLGEAIENLSNSRTNKVLRAAEVLGVEDIATYLGIEVSDEEGDKLNKMSLNQAIKYLDKLLDDANDRIKAGEEKIEDLENKLEEVKTELSNLEMQAQSEAEAAGTVDESAGEVEVESIQLQTAQVLGAQVQTILAQAAQEQDAETENESAGGSTASAASASDVIQQPEAVLNTVSAVLDGNDNIDADDAGGDDAGEVVAGGGNNARRPVEEGAVLGALRARNSGGDGSGSGAGGNSGAGTTDGAAIDDLGEESDVYIIDDMQIPTADKADAADDFMNDSISWWWLIIIAILGKTGERMYKRHKEKVRVKKNS